MLSYGYTLLRIEIEKCIRICGLDPCVGFIHSIKSGKPSLALDIMEEYRPYLVDRLIITIINKGIINSNNFIHKEDAVYCNEISRKQIIDAWERRKRSSIKVNNKSIEYGELMFKQIQTLAKCVRGECEYTPYIWR